MLVLCLALLVLLRYEGIYTPPAQGAGGVLLFPGTIGGLNWGGLAVNTEQQIVVTHHTRLPNVLTPVPRAQVEDLPTRLRITLGTTNIGGAVNTRGGLTFIAAAQDDFLRAFDTRTGELLWEARLPCGGQASPLT